MKRFSSKLHLVLILAFVLAAITTLACALEYFARPIQNIETEAELRQSQRSGLPISDEDIALHLSRAGHSRIFGFTTLAAATTSALILLALVMTEPE